MQIVFLQNVKGTAQIGDIKKVADGYAKYLLARGIAKKADTGAIHNSQDLTKKREIERTKKDAWATQVMTKLADLSITIQADANNEGHLYGSVDAKMIVAEANKHGLNLEIADVVLPHGLKEIGEHEVGLDLTPEHIAKLKVIVEAR